MELLLLIIITLMIMAISYNLMNKDIMSPSFLLLSGYLISFISTLYNLRDWDVSISIYTCVIFLIGMISFVVGELFIKRMALGRQNQKFLGQVEMIEIAGWKYAFAIGICVFALYLTYREVVRIANLNFVSWGNLAYNYKTNVVNGELEGASLSTVVQQINKFTKGFAYVFLFVFINNLFVNREKRGVVKNFINLIPSILFSFQCLIKGGRFQIIALIIGALFLYYFYWRKTRGWNKVIPFKYIIKIILFAVVVIAVFWLSREFVGRMSKDTDLMGYVTRYLGGGVALFELYLQDATMLHDNAIEVFSGIVGSLNKVGFDIVSRASHEFRSSSGIIIGNAYSALRNYYHDYGIIGVVGLNFVLSVIFSKAYYQFKLISKLTPYKTFKVVLYSAFVYTIFFQFFTDYFFTKISVGLIIEVFIMWLCFWFTVRLKIRFWR